MAARNLTTRPGRVRAVLRNRAAAKWVANLKVRPVPPAISLNLDAPAGEYWRARCEQHMADSYVGIPLWKLPEDLRVYEHLLWMCQPDTVIELGTHYGGSALWFRDRLRTLAAYGRIREPRVISIDLDVRYAHYALSSLDRDYASQISLVAGDVLDATLPNTIAPLLRDDARCLVVDDSAHTYDVTTSALNGFARFVPIDGFFVVEDGYVDIEGMRVWDKGHRGVLPAIEEWLTTTLGRHFRSRRDLELYGFCSNPHGYLQRISMPAE